MPQRWSDQAIRLGRRAARMRGIDGAGLTDEVREGPVNDRRRFDAGGDVQGCTNSAERMDARER